MLCNDWVNWMILTLHHWLSDIGIIIVLHDARLYSFHNRHLVGLHYWSFSVSSEGMAGWETSIQEFLLICHTSLVADNPRSNWSSTLHRMIYYGRLLNHWGTLHGMHCVVLIKWPISEERLLSEHLKLLLLLMSVHETLAMFGSNHRS